MNRSFERSPVAYLIKLDTTASRLLTVFAQRPRSSAATNPSTVGWSRSPIVISPKYGNSRASSTHRLVRFSLGFDFGLVFRPKEAGT